MHYQNYSFLYHIISFVCFCCFSLLLKTCFLCFYGTTIYVHGIIQREPESIIKLLSALIGKNKSNLFRTPIFHLFCLFFSN